MPKKIWDFRGIKINTRGIYKAKRVHIYELRVYRKVIFVDYLSHRLIWFLFPHKAAPGTGCTLKATSQCGKIVLVSISTDETKAIRSLDDESRSLSFGFCVEAVAGLDVCCLAWDPHINQCLLMYCPLDSWEEITTESELTYKRNVSLLKSYDTRNMVMWCWT